MIKRKHRKQIKLAQHHNFLRTIEFWKLPAIFNPLKLEIEEQKLIQECGRDSEDMKNLNEQQPLQEEWGKGNGSSYLCWRAEGYNSNFRCLDLGFGSVTEQTAVKQTHVTAACDLWMHKVKFQTVLWSCLLSHILHQDLPGTLGGNRVLGWVWGDFFVCLFVLVLFCFSLLAFIPVPLTAGVTGPTPNQPASASWWPFALPGPKKALDACYLGQQTLFKAWQTNLPEKGLWKGWKAIALKN